MINDVIYLDYAAATPVDKRVIEAMVGVLSQEGDFANAASKDHIYGWRAADCIEKSREYIANAIGASALEIIFTSGATESNNLAIRGLCEALENSDKRRHIICSQIEHEAVLSTCKYLQNKGYKVTFIKPYPTGAIDVKLLEQYIDEDTLLVSIAHANSVLGTINDIGAIGSFLKSKNIYFHTDCAQSNGLLDLDLANKDISLVSLTPEKIYGPKGIGALYINKRQNIKLAPLILGGSHEKGLRAGTLATHQIVGMGEAFKIISQERKMVIDHISSLYDLLKNNLKDINGVIFNGDPNAHLPGILSVSFENVDGHLLLPSLNKIAISTGSACSSAKLEPSYVLKAIGHSNNLAFASCRFSIGRFTSKEDIQKASLHVKQIVEKLQSIKDPWSVKRV